MTRIRFRPFITLAALALGVASGSLGAFDSSAQEPAPPPTRVVGTLPDDPARPAAENADARLKRRVQEVTSRRAQIAAEQARLRLEQAELKLVEYDDVTYPREVAQTDAAIKRAEADLRRVTGRAAWVREMVAKGYLPVGTKVDSVVLAEAEVKKARLTRELVDFARKEFAEGSESEINRLRREEEAAKRRWETQRVKEEALRPKVSVRFPTGTFEFHPGAFW